MCTIGSDYSWSYSTGDGVHSPIVVWTEPVDGATDVSRSIAAKAYFDQPMATWSIYQGSCYITDQYSNWIDSNVESDGYSATITPWSPLAGETTYTATITTSVYSEYYYDPADDYSWSFTTGAARPVVTGTNPDAGATNVDLYTTVYAYFDQSIDPTSADESTFTLENSDHVVVAAYVYCSDAQLMLYPNDVLAPFTTYTATLTTGIRGANGLYMEAPYSWSFTTGSAVPMVSSATPWDGYVGWWADRTIEAGFNLPMDTATLTSDTFFVEDPDGNRVAGTLTAYSWEVLLTPSTPLLPNTAYTATVKAGATSAQGVPMDADYSWSFTTAANASNRLSDVRLLPDDTSIAISDKSLYYGHNTRSYIEETDRTSGIRIEGGYLGSYDGRSIDVSGTLKTSPEGERYIQSQWNWIGSNSAVTPLGMTNKTVKQALLNGLEVRVFGEVKSIIDAYTVVISDGSDDAGLTIQSPDVEITATSGDYVAVTGAAGYDNARVIRAKQIDVIPH